MNDQQHYFLARIGCPPARLTVEQTAWVLNCQAYDVTTLVRAKLLKPLGNPPPNGVKYFATESILALAHDQNWLARATNALYQYWQHKNRQRKDARPYPAQSLGRRPRNGVIPHP